jgi:hypothetical protein
MNEKCDLFLSVFLQEQSSLFPLACWQAGVTYTAALDVQAVIRLLIN